MMGAIAALLFVFGQAHAEDAAQAATATDPKSLAAMEVCMACHDSSWDKPILSLFQTKHGVKGDPRTPGCQSCHGMSASHLESPVNPTEVRYTKNSTNTPEERTAKCLACHKGEARARWEGSTHQARGVVCANCHDIHRPKQRVLTKNEQSEVCFACHKEQRADFQKISHMPLLEGKMTCTDCHNPHGTGGTKLLKKDNVREVCLQCHAEKRGPFLFEHQPVAEDCINCHLPHGSNQYSLLKARPPFLCQECHDGPMGGASNTPHGPVSAGFQNGYTPSTPATGILASPSNQKTGRSCINCHSQIHGTNSPAGGYFQR
jgi:DmsE family decaheme c-type cytochrome